MFANLVLMLYRKFPPVYIDVYLCKHDMYNSRKFPPKFVVELESVVEVYPTDDIQFVCVIDDSLEKVWWEKDGKEVRIILYV